MDTQTAPENLLLPDFIKTDSGIGITFFNRSRVFPARIKYGSVPSSCLVRVPAGDSTLLEAFMAQGILEEVDGTINREIFIPVELVCLPDGERCAVLTEDISGCAQGFINLQADGNAGCQSHFGILSKMANAVGCLLDNNLFLSRWDGHQFYVNPEYGVFSVVLDGADLERLDTQDSTEATNRALAASLLCYLTGAVPVLDEDTPYARLIHAPAQSVIKFDRDNGVIRPDNSGAADFWDTLPEKLRDAFQTCFCAPDSPSPNARFWAQLLADLAENVAEEPCIHCGKRLIAGTAVCPYCQGNQDKRNMLARWLIADSDTGIRFGLALPVNMILDFAALSSGLPKGNFLRMGYNAKRNLLAMQNISADLLTVDYGELGTIEVKPNTIFALKKGMHIAVPHTNGITMTLLGFDWQDSWEDE